ncbi:MAG TPA: CheR family methyltransferase [Candidatus Eremiobacteraceae bacterium]|nr:CheR family methyltransferase [Candidatus Eremiobacteraceae bacterium]
MHKLISTSTILEHELSELRLLVERQTGVVLDCPNSALAAHIADYIESHGLGSSAALLERLRSPEQDPSVLSSLLDGLINANTGFFRHPGALNALARHVVPQICARKGSDGPSPLRIWSAGCATGEETYSIAVAVCDALSQNGASGANHSNGPNNATRQGAGNPAGNGAANGKTVARNGGIADSAVISAKPGATLSIHIVGSDLLPNHIEAADRGVYPQSALEGLPPATIRNYFSKISSPTTSPNATAIEARNEARGDARDFSLGTLQPVANNVAHLLVKPRLRSLVTFNCMNLARPGYIGRFDCIFCMDVLPQFSRAQRIALIERLHLYLEPGGYLFLSQTEKLITSNLNFRAETFDGYTFHRKPPAASAAYGR